MENRIPLEKLDSVIAEAVKDTNFGSGRIIYGFVPPDWFDLEEAMDVAKKVTSSLDTSGNLEATVLKVDSSRIGVGDKIKDPYIVGFIGPIDLRARQ